jgi:hypothetical protein
LAKSRTRELKSLYSSIQASAPVPDASMSSKSSGSDSSSSSSSDDEGASAAPEAAEEVAVETFESETEEGPLWFTPMTSSVCGSQCTLIPPPPVACRKTRRGCACGRIHAPSSQWPKNTWVCNNTYPLVPKPVGCDVSPEWLMKHGWKSVTEYEFIKYKFEHLTEFWISHQDKQQPTPNPLPVPEIVPPVEGLFYTLPVLNIDGKSAIPPPPVACDTGRAGCACGRQHMNLTASTDSTRFSTSRFGSWGLQHKASTDAANPEYGAWSNKYPNVPYIRLEQGTLHEEPIPFEHLEAHGWTITYRIGYMKYLLEHWGSFYDERQDKPDIKVHVTTRAMTIDRYYFF